MAENAYSCKTNFIILPLHRPPRFAFRLALPLLLRFIYFIVRQRFTRTMNLRLLAYFRFALSNGGQLQISLTNPGPKTHGAAFSNTRTRLRFYTRFPSLLPQFFPLSVVYPPTNRDISPFSFLFFHYTLHDIYTYIFIRDKFHSNLIQRNPIHFPFLSRNHAIYFYATISFNLSKFDLGLSLSRFFERYISNINNEKYNERPGNYVTTIRPVFLDSFGELILPFPPPSTMPSLEITLSTIRL